MLRERIDAVTVCIGYGDFLREAALYNVGHFDQWVIVTTPGDEETREVCRRHRLRCVLTDEHHRDGEFGKGRLVEKGLMMLAADSWVVHLDADVVLPLMFRHVLDRAHVHAAPDRIYGCDRINVTGWAAWQALKASGWLSRPEWHPNGIGFAGHPVVTRYSAQDGWVPIGFFQLWHRRHGLEEWRGFRTKPYPLSHGDAHRTDVQHALQWDRAKRVLIPELVVAHLESQPGRVGANWKGRSTPRFGPPPAAGSEKGIS
jgi:hypothetical protein